MGISAHFLYDAATNTEGLVDIFLFELSGGNLIEQDYFEGGPLVTNGREITLLHGSAGWRRELGGVGRRPLP